MARCWVICLVLFQVVISVILAHCVNKHAKAHVKVEYVTQIPGNAGMVVFLVGEGHSATKVLL